MRCGYKKQVLSKIKKKATSVIYISCSIRAMPYKMSNVALGPLTHIAPKASLPNLSALLPRYLIQPRCRYSLFIQLCAPCVGELRLDDQTRYWLAAIGCKCEFWARQLREGRLRRLPSRRPANAGGAAEGRTEPRGQGARP